MHQTLVEFFVEAQKYTAIFDTWAQAHSPAAKADHLCYKCSSSDEFMQLRKLFEAESIFIYQSIISQRRIAIVKFTKPLPTHLGDIWFLELSDQKPDGSQIAGFDHIEIYPLHGSMDELAARLEQKGIAMEKIVRPHHTTYDIFIAGQFKARIEPDALVDKIKREEMQ